MVEMYVRDKGQAGFSSEYSEGFGRIPVGYGDPQQIASLVA